MYTTINFIKSQWLAFILLLLFILYLIFSQREVKYLEEHKSILEERLDLLEKKEVEFFKKLDTLKIENTIIVQKEKILIKKEYDTIKAVDNMPFSELQSFFSNRYYKENSIE
jgi:hypothetical protein